MASTPTAEKAETEKKAPRQTITLQKMPFSDDNEVAEDEEKPPMSLWTARGIVLLMAMICGTNFPSIGLLEATVEPSLASALRFGLASVALIPMLRGVRQEAILPGLEIGVWLSLGYVGQAIGLQSMNSSVAAFICSMSVIVCPFLMALSGKRIDRKSWVAAVIALAGVGFLELGDGAIPSANDAWALFQPLFFGMSFFRTEVHVERLRDQVFPLTALQTMVIGATATAWSAVDGTLQFDKIAACVSDPTVAAALAWTGLVGTAVVLWGETATLFLVSSAEAALLFATEPLWSTAFAIPILGETPGLTLAIGGSLVLSAIMVRIFGPMDEVEVAEAK